MARPIGVGQSVNGIFGLLKILKRPDEAGARDTELPYHQAVRFLAGHGMAVSESGGIVTLNCDGGTGPTGATGPQGETGPQGVMGVSQAIGLHDTTHSPVLLCQFQGSLADTSGNSLSPSVDAGTELYSAMVPGLMGVKLDGTLRLKRATNSLLAIAGNITIEMILMLSGPTAVNSQIVTYTLGTDDTTANANYLYQVGFGDVSRRPTWFQEFATGSDSSYTPADQALPAKRVFHLAATRTSNVVQFYSDGRPLGPTGTVTQATGGSTSSLYIGGEGGPTPRFSTPMILASLKIVASALTAAQIKAEYNRTVGKFYGSI